MWGASLVGVFSMSRRVLLDTSFIIALENRNDRHHERAPASLRCCSSSTFLHHVAVASGRRRLEFVLLSADDDVASMGNHAEEPGEQDDADEAKQGAEATEHRAVLGERAESA